MSDSRQRPALGAPPAELSRFPRARLTSDTVLYRAHTRGRSPWWFSSDLSGRFDLLAPHGTCYLATDVETALRERFGHELVELGVVSFEAAARTGWRRCACRLRGGWPTPARGPQPPSA